jgi:hypothetical protein
MFIVHGSWFIVLIIFIVLLHSTLDAFLTPHPSRLTPFFLCGLCAFSATFAVKKKSLYCTP